MRCGYVVVSDVNLLPDMHNASVKGFKTKLVSSLLTIHHDIHLSLVTLETITWCQKVVQYATLPKLDTEFCKELTAKLARAGRRPRCGAGEDGAVQTTIAADANWQYKRKLEKMGTALSNIPDCEWCRREGRKSEGSHLTACTR